MSKVTGKLQFLLLYFLPSSNVQPKKAALYISFQPLFMDTFRNPDDGNKLWNLYNFNDTVIKVFQSFFPPNLVRVL